MRCAFKIFLRATGSVVALGLLATACANQAVKVEDRLVDGTSLPSEEMLSREKIEINQGFGGEGFGEHFLSYELASNNSLVVTHTFRPEDKVIGDEVFVVSPYVAMKARKQLWRVRPDALENIGSEVRPSGCLPRWDHETPEIAVGFGSSNEMFGTFFLPRPASCDTPAAKAARQMLNDVLKSFPRSKVAETFVKMHAQLNGS
ncbi:MAG TPA: hypothetical protein VGN68_15850 [Sphingopyxis sp.]|jgi:hypothetical protein|uniref:hypothetical protein n=1 Tax=Sphingopyxis sp. TaxID=1908224 RepID=UPI002E0ED0A0|nr:hypothetical protein [Sphingopyxis sp.]